MEYKIVPTRRIDRFATREDIESAEGLDTTVADLILATQECLLWVVSDGYRYPVMDGNETGELRPLPLAANYHKTGSLDIRDKILVQDPIGMRGPYVLDRGDDPSNRVFRKSDIQGFGKPQIIDAHTAGDKVPSYRYYFIGAPMVLFEELKSRGFSFEE